jgi:futalosine hydrolase
MKIIITAATNLELKWVDKKIKNKHYNFNIQCHVSGVGIAASAVSLTKLVCMEKPDLIIQMGIAGAFNKKEKLGKTFVIKKDCFADMGVEENEEWKDIFDLKLTKNNCPPYAKKGLPNPFLQQYNLLNLPEATGITVNTINTQKRRIEQLKKKYAPDIETMEGAALHYVCRDAKVAFLQIRSTSNYAGERNKTKWLLKESIENVNQTVLQWLDKFYEIA